MTLLLTTITKTTTTIMMCTWSACLHQSAHNLPYSCDPCDACDALLQGAPWCFSNNAWTLSTEYLIEWGARWGPYMRSQPYRLKPLSLAAATHFCASWLLSQYSLGPSGGINGVFLLWWLTTPSRFLVYPRALALADWTKALPCPVPCPCPLPCPFACDWPSDIADTVLGSTEFQECCYLCWVSEG